MGKTINASIAEQNLIIEPSVISVAGSVNAYSLKITYDEEWNDVDAKIVTFSGANGQSFAIQDNGEENGVTIPWEVLQCPGKVSVGVVGYVGSEMKLTTTGLYNRNTFVVLPEAFGLKSAMTPTPDVYQKLVQTINQFNEGLTETNEKIGDLNNLETEAKNNLVAAINEALDGGGGEGTVKSVNQKEPDAEGNVELSAGDVGAATAESVEELAATVVIKQDALSQTQLDAVNSGINSTKVGQIATNASDIDTINGKIPAQASAQNQLADKNFVNSSVATNTANYISNDGEPFTSLAQLEAYSGDLSNNDYAFVVGTDSAGNTTYTRYKYVADTQEWAEEYVLNNSSFTANQWATINSGITSGDVTKLAGIETGAEVNAIDSISFDGTPLTPDANKNVDIPAEIKTLTTEDYNYPADNPTGVAIWLLPASGGYYRFASGVNILFSSSSSVSGPGYLILGNIAPNNQRPYFILGGGRALFAGVLDVTNGSQITLDQDFSLIQRREIHDNLLSNSGVLSAKQGRILNNHIGDLTTLTTTDKTSAVAAINEVNTKAVGTAETITIATNDWAALSSSDPYDYSATVNVTATIEANSTVELLNDQAVLFSTYGFAIGAVDTTNNTVTIYSIGQPDASVSLKINVKG